MQQIPLSDQIKCVEREVALRKAAYPKWVESRRLTQAKADQEIAAMEAVRETLNVHGRIQTALRLPVIVCLCGSTRFYREFQEANYRETMAGRIVLTVGFYPRAQDEAHGGDRHVSPEQKIALDDLHLRKIDLADEVLILNVGGYIGESTARELRYARELGKPVRFLEGERNGESIS